MKDIDKMICNEMYECCKENAEFISSELVYEMGAYETYDMFLKDVKSSPDTELWTLCHILDGCGDKDFVECMQLSWVEEEYIDYLDEEEFVEQTTTYTYNRVTDKYTYVINGDIYDSDTYFTDYKDAIRI